MAEQVTLDSIGGGVLNELFGAELDRILANIADPNTDAKALREVTIKVAFKPTADRDVADVQLKCSSKLAGISTVDTRLFMGRKGGKLIAVESDPRQSNLFDADRPNLSAVAQGEFSKKEGD